MQQRLAGAKEPKLDQANLNLTDSAASEGGGFRPSDVESSCHDESRDNNETPGTANDLVTGTNGVEPAPLVDEDGFLILLDTPPNEEALAAVKQLAKAKQFTLSAERYVGSQSCMIWSGGLGPSSRWDPLPGSPPLRHFPMPRPFSKMLRRQFSAAMDAIRDADAFVITGELMVSLHRRGEAGVDTWAMSTRKWLKLVFTCCAAGPGFGLENGSPDTSGQAEWLLSCHDHAEAAGFQRVWHPGIFEVSPRGYVQLGAP